MNNRDRLIELLEQAKTKAQDTIGSMNNGFGAWYADYLLEHGVIVPPCKVGDTVYIKNKPLKISFIHINSKANFFVITLDCYHCADCPFYNENTNGLEDCPYGYFEFTEEDIGKTVFLTREEAEKALEGNKDNS